MPILDASEYKPPLLFRNGNINTIYPFLFRKSASPVFDRKRFDTKDGDFIDLDILSKNRTKLAVICHGLEGNSDSQYIQHTSTYLFNNEWDVLCINFRSCSGEMNRKLEMYHSGFTQDVHEVISTYQKEYEEVALIGFSLGGNVALKYISDGIFDLPEKLKAVVALSVPIDLSKSSLKISSRANWIYDKRFRISLEQKIREKHKYFSDEVDLSHLKKIKTLRDFDEYYTGPMHGFDGAEDYYSKCNSKQFLENISIPALLITALDDPFLPEESYPFEIAESHQYLHFMAPKFGGHVGFTTFGSNFYWNELKTLLFINNPDLFNSAHKPVAAKLY
ncbi:MAG: alpha/beta fold hydrolase [Saprospiraceae bacterium]|nr:alpha/beta fold hydrolase [Saprospiraceae bacterium]